MAMMMYPGNSINAFGARRRYLRSPLFALSFAVLQLFTSLAAAQSGAPPNYISAMDDFEVRSLSGAQAPASGNLSMRDVTPSEWINNDPAVSGLEGVITAWSGGAKGNGSTLFVHGGGHSDSANNGLYTFDFRGTDRPNGWETPLVISRVSDVIANGYEYADGKPVAVHTYDGLFYARHNAKIYRFGGSRYSNGFMAKGAFKFDTATDTWSRVPDYPNTAGGAKTIYDPDSGKIFVTMNDTLEGYFFRTSNDTWSSAKSYGGNGFPYDSLGAWDESRGRGIIVGDGEMSLLQINFDSETVSVSGFSASGSTSIFGYHGISAAYDRVADVYWLFGGPTSSPGWSTLYEMNADGPPWTVRAHSLSGSSITRKNGMIGSWGRFVLMDSWRAIGLIASETSPVFVIKLPADGVTIPKPPSSLATD
jgi:hypothetical protein